MTTTPRGPITLLTNNLSHIRNILTQEGFTDPSPLQTVKPGQVFGLIKKVNQIHEMHVRVYDDFTLDSEIELSRDFLEHPHEVRPLYGPLIDILRRHSVNFSLNNPIPPDPANIGTPKTLTPWKPIAVVGGAILLAGLFAAYTRSKNSEEDD